MIRPVPLPGEFETRYHAHTTLDRDPHGVVVVRRLCRANGHRDFVVGTLRIEPESVALSGVVTPAHEVFVAYEDHAYSNEVQARQALFCLSVGRDTHTAVSLPVAEGPSKRTGRRK